MRQTMCDRVAAYLTARPNQWVNGRELSAIGGYAAYRTRISDLRRAPYSMTIENRVHRVTMPDGTVYTQSCYRYIPAEQQSEVA